MFVQAPQTTAPLGFYTPSDAKYHWFLEDARDSVMHVVDDGGVIENTYAYDAWGNMLVATEVVTQPLRFMSKRYDQTAGLYLWHMRVYDPVLARFLQRIRCRRRQAPMRFWETIRRPNAIPWAWAGCRHGPRRPWIRSSKQRRNCRVVSTKTLRPVRLAIAVNFVPRVLATEWR